MPVSRPFAMSARFLPVTDTLAWTFVLVYADAMRAYRGPYWIGGSWQGWAGSLMAMGIYAGLLGLGVALLITATGRSAQIRALAADNAAPLAALAVWGLLTLLGGDPGITAALGLFALAAAYATASHVTRRLLPHVRAWLPFIVASAFSGGLISMAIVDEVFLLAPGRAPGVTAFTLVHTAFMLAVLTAAAALAGRAVPVVVALLGVVMATAPAGVLLLRPPQLPAPESAPPNLVFITFDALRADWISAYGGGVPMPAFERLSGEGIRFERAYTLGPWTIPSMFACFASNYPEALPPGADREQLALEMAAYRFDLDGKTLAERLLDEHILTAAYGGNTLLSDPEGILRGFALQQVWPHRPPVRYGMFEHAPLLQAAWFRLGLPGVEERPVDSTRILVRRAERFVRQNAGRPYFLWVHFMDPHAAFAPPARFRPDDVPWPVYCNADPRWGTPLTDADGRLEVSPAEQEAIQALYEGEMRYIDEALGQVLDALDQSGVRGRSFVVVSSDHGEEFWDHGEFGHGHSLYDEMVRAPLLVTGPGIPAGITLEQPVSHLDLMPTMAGFLGLEPEEAWLGIDRSADWSAGLDGPSEPVFAQGTNLYSRHGPQQMMITGGIKYIRSLEGEWETAYAIGPAPDIGAPVDLEPAEAERRAAVMDALPVRGLDTAPDLDESLREQLRAFGYVHE